ncbi:MAG TPA: polysaccharide deacetylase family protein [Kofleriaceae bacterium]
MRWPLVLVLATAGCTTGSDFIYPWDGRGVVCSNGIDDYLGEPAWDLIGDSLDVAAEHGWVTMLHAHEPGATIQLATLERVLTMAEDRHLELVTFRDFETLSPRGGLALAFDDNQPTAWLLARDLLLAHHARVTFFVTRWKYLTDAEHDEIRLLAADGHDLQPHSVDHLHANDYVAEHGVDGYLADEVLPSFEPLAAEGYPPTTYAYPFGDRSDALDAAILEHVAHVRTTLGPCPY